MSSPPKVKVVTAAQYVHNARKNQISALLNQPFNSKKVNVKKSRINTSTVNDG